MSDILKKRSFICREIVDSEQRYVRDLEVIINVFMEPMRRKHIVNEELIMGIFENLNAAIKQDSEEPDYANANLGAVILRFCSFFRMYSNYCKLQRKATAVIHELKKTTKFANFYTACKKNPACRGMEMTSFLIMPVQRIPRYQLLLKELQKRTPENHPDMPFIRKALESIAEVAKICDSAMSDDKETSLKLSIQNSLGSKFILMKASRKLLKYEKCIWNDINKKIPITAFLFSDLLILTNQFESEVNLHVIAKYELYMFKYYYRKNTPNLVYAESAFETMSFEYATPDSARKWYLACTNSLNVVLKRSIGSNCEICYGPLQPAYCCHCMKCGRICCEHCCTYINNNDRKTSSKNLVCLSCKGYNDNILNKNASIKELVNSTNSQDLREFVQPVFVCNMKRKTHLSLPEGWQACMLNDSRVYYFNEKLWLSSWSLPTKECTNDSPYGWQKYYDDKLHPFYYNAKTKKVLFKRPIARVDLVDCCPSCSYLVTNLDLKKGYCPCCNTCLKEPL